jgi:hypothetical protein
MRCIGNAVAIVMPIPCRPRGTAPPPMGRPPRSATPMAPACRHRAGNRYADARKFFRAPPTSGPQRAGTAMRACRCGDRVRYGSRRTPGRHADLRGRCIGRRWEEWRPRNARAGQQGPRPVRPCCTSGQ